MEVILLSKNDSDTGLRVFNSLDHHGLPITRAGFVNGQDSHLYIDSFDACLFLSADQASVEAAIMKGHSAGRVLESTYADDPADQVGGCCLVRRSDDFAAGGDH